MSPISEFWIAVLLCWLVGGASCFVLIMLTYKFGRRSPGAATLIGAIIFAALFGTGGFFAIMAQPEPGGMFVMMLAAFFTLQFGLVTGPLAFVAVTAGTEQRGE